MMGMCFTRLSDPTLIQSTFSKSLTNSCSSYRSSQSPLLLYLFSLIRPSVSVSFLYGLVDCCCAWMMLQLFRMKWGAQGPEGVLKLKKDEWMINPAYQIKDWQLVAWSVACFLKSIADRILNLIHIKALSNSSYLFSPLNFTTSLSKSTIVFTNLSVLLALTAALKSMLTLVTSTDSTRSN